MLYLTSYCSPRGAILDAVADIVGLGITNIELTGGTLYEYYDKDALIALKEQLGLNFLIHNYFPPQSEEFVLNLASTDPGVVARTHQALVSSIALAHTFGLNLYSLHAGFSYDQLAVFGNDGLFTPMPGPRYEREHLFAGVERVAKKLLSPGFRLAMENAFPLKTGATFSLLATPEDILEFLAHFADLDGVGLLLDLGHLNLSARCLGFDKAVFLSQLISEWAHKIFEVHVSANNGEHDAHGLNTVDDFDIIFLKHARKALEHAPIVLEWHNNISSEAVKAYYDIARYLDIEQKGLETH